MHHDAELSFSRDMHRGKQENRRQDTLDSQYNNHIDLVGDGRTSSDVSDTNFTSTAEVSPFSTISEHDDHVCSDYALHELRSIKTYKRRKGGISDSEKRRKVSDALVSSLKPNEEGVSSLFIVQNKRQNSSLDNSDQALPLGCLDNTLETEVVAGLKILLDVVEDIQIEKPLSVCSDIEHTSGGITNRIEMENPKESINEDGAAKEVSVADFEQAKRQKLSLNQNAVSGVFSSEQFEECTTIFKDEKASGDASREDPPAAPLDQRTQSKMEDVTTSLSDSNEMGDNVTQLIDQENHIPQMLPSSLERALSGYFSKKLLVLDINGLIADIVSDVTDEYEPDTIIGRKAVFKRPFCDDFLQFCFERYNVGVWTSRTKRNVQFVLDFIMGKTRQNLLFCWDQSHCTETGFNTLENRDKPLFLKELKKLWEKHEPNLPWEKGEYNESNTLLLDDSPYKALRNPPNTAIFPHTYQYTDEKDNSLGPGGDLRVYLEGLALAENVQKYVEQNPYGQPPITDASLSWHFYLKVLGTSAPQFEDNANSSDLEHANGGNKMKIWMDESKETINKENSAKYVASAELAGETFDQAKSDKLNSNQNAICDAYPAEQKLKEFTKSLEQKGHSKIGEIISSISDDVKDNTTQVRYKENHPPPMLQSSPGRAVTGCFRRKLLVLDVHGLLAEIISFVPDGYKADAIIANRAVFKRPFCDDFLQFCFERFNIGIWSSKPRGSVESVLDFLMGNQRHNLLFCWHLSQCTWTGYNTVEKRDRPLVLKELKKLWEKHDRYLPWERGEYNESNTLLVDDAPHKALCNPPNTAIFPGAYRCEHENDNSLGPGGDLRVYLEGLALAENVQKYVEQNPFGQRPISEKNLSWRYYLKVIDAVSSGLEHGANNFSAYSSQTRRWHY